MVFILKFNNGEINDTYYLENSNFEGDFYELAFELASKFGETNKDTQAVGVMVVDELINNYGFVETKAKIINFDENFF